MPDREIRERIEEKTKTNTRPAVELRQISFGPVFSKEDLDEIMPEIAKWKLSYECCPMISFPGKKGYRGRINV